MQYIACLLVKSTTREHILAKFGIIKNTCGVSLLSFLHSCSLHLSEHAFPVPGLAARDLWGTKGGHSMWLEMKT